MYTTSGLDDLVHRLSALIPPPLKQAGEDFEKNMRAVLESGLRRMNLVTREEFDIQKAVLLKTRQQVDDLQQRMGQFEEQFSTKDEKSSELQHKM